MQSDPTAENQADHPAATSRRATRPSFPSIDLALRALVDAPETADASETASPENAEDCFESALSSSWLAAQPIVDVTKERITGYEMLLRSSEPRLPSPLDLIDAAERLGRTREVGRSVRARVAALFERCPPATRLFVNLHPSDLTDDLLLTGDDPLCVWANRTVLEITQRNTTAVLPDARAAIARLKQIGFGVALDNVRADRGGLLSLGLVEPDVVKLGRSLIRNIDHWETNARLAASLVETCRELGSSVVAETVETASERRVLSNLGVSLMQGCLFARPDRPFPTARF